MAKTQSLAELEFMEYRKLKEILDYSPSNGLYEELMRREDAVLKTINRVVDHSNKRELEAKEILNVPLSKLGSHFARTVYEMFDDLTNAKTAKEMTNVFTNKTDRVICAGAFIVCVAVFLFFVSVTN